MLALAATSALMGDTLSIEHIVVTESALDNDLYMGDANGSSQSFAAKSIATLSSQANMNPFNVVQFSPSVNFTPA